MKPLDRGSDGHLEGMIEFCVGEGGAFPPFRSVLPRAPSTNIGPPWLCLVPLASKAVTTSDQPRMRASACTISTATATGAEAQSRMVQRSGMVSLR